MRGLLLLTLMSAALSGASSRHQLSETGTAADTSTSRAARLVWLHRIMPPVAHTSEGRLRGVTRRSSGGYLFYSFKGIPYAQPPKRFQPPERHPGWHGVRDAYKHGSKCLQWVGDQLLGAEDCLSANVYTRLRPAAGGKPAAGRLPVMVFIYGGGFRTGDSDGDKYGPRYFMDEDVVLVTFNYRLGPLGFFTTHDAAAPGNYGLRDQLLLLQWVRDNIAAFGGDPHSVTIFGQSAGGASVSLLVLSPLAKGLFHHAISQSGASFSAFAANGRRKGLAVRFAAELGCSGGDNAAIVECARAVSANALMNASKAVRENEIYTDGRFLPRVDAEATHPFLPYDPRILLQTGMFNLVPWMSGVTEEEGTFFLSNLPDDAELLAKLYAKDVPVWSQLSDLTTQSQTSIVDCDANPLQETAKIILFLTDRLGDPSPTNLLPAVRLLSDRVVVTGTSEEIRLASAFAPVYKYVLDHRGPGRLYAFPPVFPELGPTHADDLAYMFSQKGRPLQLPGTAAHTMIRFIVSLWTSFARTGRPSSSVRPTPDWPIFTEDSQRHMRLNWEPTLDQRLFDERVSFWQTVRINEPWRHAVDDCDASSNKNVFEPISVGNVSFVFPL